MKTGKLLVILQIILVMVAYSQTYIPPGDVSGSWSLSGSPFYILGNITIPNDSTLIIEPGVLVEFQGYYALNVQGQLKAVGDEALNITFTVNDTTGFYDPHTTLGGWNGIQFIDTPIENDTSIINYCTIQFGKAVGSSPPDNSGGAIFISNFNKVIISNSIISYNSAGGTDSPAGGGIGFQFASITLNDNEISHNHAFDGGGIQIWESDPVFKNNSILFNTAEQAGGGIWIGGESNSEFNKDIISNNTAEGDGGGIICWQTTNTIFNSVNIINNVGYYGGGANFIDCDVQLNNCEISDNSSGWIGGGIHAYSCVLEINNTNFERDTTFIFGGAMGVYFSDLDITNSSFTDNSARILGGGIHSDESNIYISGTSFTRDTTGESGGAIFNWLCHTQFNDCNFSENSSSNGGAISSSNSDLLIDSCWFYQNSAQNQGGALEYIADTSGFVSVSQLEISNSTFEENSASTRCGAALIEQYNSNEPLANVSINNCEFKNNDALRVGALRFGNISNFILSSSIFIGNTVTQHTAACTFTLYSSGYVDNCLFAGNVAGGGTSGGAGVSNNSTVDFMNCTFTNNSSGSGGGIQLRQSGIAKVTNSVFWGNYPDQISLDAINDTSTCILYSNYNDIQYGVDSIHINDTISVVNWGVGNIDAEPLFADTLNNDFHLQDLSPCIATGIDSIEVTGFWYYCPSTDIEGNPRPNPLGTMPDMGAYESEFPVRVSDQNLDLPTEFVLYQNYPNPFNPSTTIKWEMPEPGLVTLIVYDVLGRKLTMLVNEELSAGKHEVVFDASRFSSGIYFYQLRAVDPSTNSGQSFIQTKK
ncbi:MAG: T9SS type A sorting domain-containing protein, partial [Ignavibacteriaceae bacterium]|nr:T9SS type A sorting domain-containing protein [Ignavibacteriaceae bacterium]